MMIYDTFAFFNELDLLEIRLNIMDPVVDRFVLVEATRTFQKKEKPLYFEQNKQRFAQFLPKIEHVIVDQYPNFFTRFRVPKTWDYDNHQKEQILQGLKSAKPDDIIIVSDLDEVPNPKQVLAYKDAPGVKIFQQKLFYYYLNCWVTDYEAPNALVDGYKPWNGTVMCRYDQIKTIKKTRGLKDEQGSDLVVVPDGGWHFSYLGGTKIILEKIEATAHKEHNLPEYKDPARIETLIRQGKDLFQRNIQSKVIPLDASYPDFLVQNQDRYSHLVLRP
ncbi:MAG: N-acetylglucosaminyltransferase [Pseudobdellovibrionaceae bacterium]